MSIVLIECTMKLLADGLKVNYFVELKIVR